MTELSPFSVTVRRPQPGTTTLHVHGDLDYETCDELLDTATRHLPGCRELRLDCAELAFCDSMGLSCLLLLHRRAAADGTRLHLDNRSDAFDRLLRLTGVLGHLTAARADATGTRVPLDNS
ncbi:STAS domain-containing protein [Streptomyces sp. PTM05]|uniref:STAS domain-containing protein n=1 Tax=Streptantibioticus parmotrematis TaxID=2873249 RepID=A0ABS7QSM2_9ACTN|nr:STAS domain-containing protein [Streptantibioticus parmotrematis]MBY8885390.1 STAS domain-containing protein [Streptantibioticus parmotrematis]